jgi:ATP-binding cassette subfamily C protein LapB
MSNAAAIRKDLLNPEGFRISVSSLLLSTLAINVLSLAMPVMTLQVYDRILPNPGSGTLPVLIAGVGLAIVLEAILRLTRFYLMGWAGAAYEHRLSCEGMKKVLHADLSHMGALGIGEHLRRMSSIGKLKDFYNGYALITISELIFVPVFMGIIIYIAGPLVAVPATVLMIFTLLSLAQGQELRAALKRRDDLDDKRYNFLIEALEGIHAVKAFSLENNFTRRYEALEDGSSFANYSVTQTMAGTFNTGTIFSHIMVAGIIAVGSLFVMQGQITTGGLIATMLLSGRVMQPVQRALVLWAKYQDYVLARRKSEEIFELPQNVPVYSEGPEPARTGTVGIRNLCFHSNHDGSLLLNDINLNLPFGECVLISARDDAAKSAFLDILAGVYPATTGEILIDGQNVQRYAPENLVNHIGYIRNEGFIFRGTIRDNMTCFGQINERKAQEMASLLQINRNIARLPSGYDTFLSGNDTDSVTPGLKQRIALVRVLAPRPRIILFDNADKGLDHEGYVLIYSLLARLKGAATLILFSDDCNIQGLAERFYTLADGKLEETYLNLSQSHIRPYQELQL